MDLKEFTKSLNGREYREEITKEEEALAKELGYVVVFGYSDDNVEFRGAIDEEVGRYEGGTIYLDEEGLLEPCQCNCKYYKLAKNKAKVIKAIFGKEYIWQFNTEIVHEEFYIFEDGEKFCKGIIFDIKNLKS